MENGTESLSSELIKVIEYLSDKLKLTVDITSEQILEFSEQFAYKIIKWEMLTSILSLLICTLITIFIIVVTLKLNRKFDIVTKIKYTLFGDKKSGTDSSSNYYGISMGFFVLYTVIICLWMLIILPETVGNILDIVKCIIFPEKVILDFISSNLSM